MMRVLLWYWGRRGGGPRYTLELARALRGHGGLDVHMSLSRQSEMFDAFQRLELPVHVVNTYTSKISAVFSLFRLGFIRRSFRQYLCDRRIEVVVCTMSHLWNSVMLAVIRRAGARYVLALHDAVPHSGDNYFIRKWLLAKEIAAADGIVTLTSHVRDQLCEVYGYPRSRTWVVPHGVFDYAIARQGRTFPMDRPMRIVFFGRILPYKGLDILLLAFQMLEREYPGIELAIIGSGDLSPYRNLISQLSNVIVENQWISEGSVGSVFERADLVVASYVEASQSGVVSAAFSAALPVVVTPVGGLVEQVQHLENGYVAREPSPDAVAEAIRHFLSDPVFYARCSQNALRQVKERLNWDVIARQIADVAKQVASLPRKRA